MKSPVPQSPSNGSTLILPYGYQIDLDFINYCENLTNVDHTDAELQRRNRRRQRQSMEVMLGIQLEMQQQMNEYGEIWEKKPPEPPPRTHSHTVESPIVPRLNSRVTQWDPALSDVVSDFERTLERSKKGKEAKPERVIVREVNVDDGRVKAVKDTCISPPPTTKKPHHINRAQSEKPHHISIESIDGLSSVPISPPERTSSLDKKRIRDLEEQVKLIPLLQMQIQSLKDERKQLLIQIENSRAPSSTSSSSNTQNHFQVLRVSPVSLHSMKLPQNSIPKRTVGTNTLVILRRDVGSSSEKPTTVNASTLTDFKLPCDGHDRLYSERDLMKTVELVHSKMRKSMASVGVQYDEIKVTRNVGSETRIESKSVSCGTEEPQLMSVSTGGISIAPSSREVSPSPSLSLKDLSKLPVTRNSTTQTSQGSVHHQSIQATPQATSKSTDSKDLIKTIHRSAGTEVIHKKDQNVHTEDLVKVHNTSTNTTAPPVIQKRSTASNTVEVPVKSVGVNCEELIIPLSTSGSASKIPRPSPGVQRKVFLRQETFTVNNGEASNLLDISKELEVTKIQSGIPKLSAVPSKTIEEPKTSAFASVNQKPTSLSQLSNIEPSPPPPPSVAAILSKLKETSPLSPPPAATADSSAIKSPLHTNISSIFAREKSPSPFGAHSSDFRRTPERERTPVSECPVEKVLQLTMNHRSPSPLPVVEKKVEEVVEPTKMTLSPSIEYLDDEDDEEEDEYEDDEFNDEQMPSSMPMRPPPTSISTIRLVQEGRVRIKPTKEMMSALKVINDHLEKHPEPIESQIRAARDIAAKEWFQISSREKANPDNVEDYLDYFEEQSWDLLTYMVNLVDTNGNLAMHYSVSHGNFDVVSILLDSKVCDINQTNNAGYTAIMLVSLAKLVVPEHQTVVHRLFKLADVNIRATKNSQTALMLAVSHGNFTMVQMLVEAGADINIQDDDGSTALMCAAEQGHLDIIKYLLAQPDCDSTKHDVDGNTALKISLEAGYHDIGCLLYAHEHLLRSKVGVKRTSSRKSSTSSLT